MSNNLIMLSALVLLPLIPAYILFKALPSTAVVKGPLAGLNVDLGGAFGGYVALTVFIATFYSMKMTGAETWTVEGKLQAAEGEVPRNLECLLRPPILQVQDDRFEFNIPIADPSKPLRLVFQAPGYIPQTVTVKGPDGKFDPEYGPKVYDENKMIVLEKPVEIVKKPPQSAGPVASAQPVGSGG